MIKEEERMTGNAMITLLGKRSKNKGRDKAQRNGQRDGREIDGEGESMRGGVDREGRGRWVTSTCG
jgi:hypothetical protein